MRRRVLLGTFLGLAAACMLFHQSGLCQSVLDPSCRSGILRAIYGTLIGLDESGSHVPALVEDWSIAEEGDVILNLREGLMFHNSEAFAAEAILYNWEHEIHLYPDFVRPPARSSGLIARVDIIDDYTIRIVPGSLCPTQLLTALSGPYGMIAAPGAVEELGWEFGFFPVGAGPFRLVEFAQEQHLILEKSWEYWAGPPSVPALVFLEIRDELTRFAALESGEVDVSIGREATFFRALGCTSGFRSFGDRADFHVVRDEISNWEYMPDLCVPFEDVRFGRDLRIGVASLSVCELENAQIELTNSHGQPAERFALLDSVFASFRNLRPDTTYEVRVVRSDEEEIARLVTKSDVRGTIPTTVLWWDVGVEYDDRRAGRLNYEMPYQDEFVVRLSRGGTVVAEAAFGLTPIEESGPIVFACNVDGDPQNGFDAYTDEVYARGIGFPAGSIVHLHAVVDQASWRPADELNPENGESVIVELGPRESEFLVPLWSETAVRPGAYDLVAEYRNANGLYDRMDVIDMHYGVGFTVIGTKSVASAGEGEATQHVEEPLACQKPPTDATGNVIGAPNPSFVDTFSPKDEVWVAVNPTAGGGNYAAQIATIWVVKARPSTDWDTPATSVLSKTHPGYRAHKHVAIQPGCANVNYHQLWAGPSVGDYDIVVDFTPFGTYDKGIDIIDGVKETGFKVPGQWISLYGVSLNHAASGGQDAIDIRKSKTTDVLVPEYLRGKRTDPAAYVINQTITIKAVFEADTSVSSAEIRGVSLGQLGDTGTKSATFKLRNDPYNPGTQKWLSEEIVFQISGTAPGSIRRFDQRWQWYASKIDGASAPEVPIGQSLNRVYVLVAQPKAPWGSSAPTDVWSEALDYACYWAYGESTPAGAAGELAKDLFLGVGAKYDTVSGDSKYFSFNLTGFLQNIPNVGTVNCYDMAHALVTFGTAVGCELRYDYRDPFGYLNCIYAVGKGWANNPFYDKPIYSPLPVLPGDATADASGKSRSSFANHAFANLAVPGSSVGKIFDACLQVDSDPDPDDGPKHTAAWMIDKLWTAYASAVVDTKPASYPAATENLIPFTVW